MDDAAFDKLSREELRAIEDAFTDVDPDLVEVSTSDGVLTLTLRDKTRVVINSHRAARQIWMAAVSTAWHFDPPASPEPERWIASRTGEDLRATLKKLIVDRTGAQPAL